MCVLSPTIWILTTSDLLHFVVPNIMTLLQLQNNFDNDTMSVTPVRVSTRGSPYHLKQACNDTGRVISSDQAYIDTILDPFIPSATDATATLLQHFYLISSRIKGTTPTSTRSVIYCHTLFYKGEPVWQLETNDNCNGKEVWGLSSYCLVTGNGYLRVRVNHKGRKAVGQGWNTWETRDFCLKEILFTSGQARQKDMIAWDFVDVWMPFLSMWEAHKSFIACGEGMEINPPSRIFQWSYVNCCLEALGQPLVLQEIF